MVVGGLGFAASAAVHLATFTPLGASVGDGHVLLLFAGAFVPLIGMVMSLRRGGTPVRPWGRMAVVDWRRLMVRVPPGMRLLVVATASYALMNLTLSILVAVEEEGAAAAAGTTRMLTGHLLLLYLVPLVYFAFAHPAAGPGPDPGEA